MTVFNNPLDWNVKDLTKGEAFDKHLDEQSNIDDAYFECFRTKAGKIVLEHLTKNTIEAATWRAGLPYEQAIANGFAREGQNALVRNMIDRTERGRTQQNKRKR